MTVERESPEGILLAMTWGGILDSGALVLETTKWTLTGISAIVAVLFANVESLQRVVAETPLKWGLCFLVVSMLVGALSFVVATGIHASGETSKRVQNLLTSPESANALKKLNIEEAALKSLLLEPYWGPLKWLADRSFTQGYRDQLYAEKFGIRMVCLSAIVILTHYICGVAGLVLLILGII